MTTKVLLDTDIGTDIDDAFCLAYLLARPDCELLGITTVTGEAEKRAMMASAMCKVAGVQVPIYPGCDSPLLVQQQQQQAQQAVALSRWEHTSRFPRGEAIEFLRRTIRQHPGEVVLLTIGPLTNIGLLFAVDPELPGLLRGLVMMAGLFTTRVPGFGMREWNAFGDPHASAMVYRAPVRSHRSVGLDVTTQVNMPADEVRALCQRSELLRPVLDFAEVWFQQWPGMTFHDPLAAATIFDEQICSFERGSVEIELASEPLKGLTLWTPDQAGSHAIATRVDAARFFEHLYATFG